MPRFLDFIGYMMGFAIGLLAILGFWIVTATPAMAQEGYRYRYNGSDHPRGNAENYRYRGESDHSKQGGYGNYLKQRQPQQQQRDWNYQPHRQYEARPRY